MARMKVRSVGRIFLVKFVVVHLYRLFHPIPYVLLYL